MCARGPYCAVESLVQVEKHTRNISNSRMFVQYAGCPYMTCNFQGMRRSKHKWHIE